jgi:quinol monooxygenase YgiN
MAALNANRNTDSHFSRYADADALAIHRKQSYYTSAFKQFDEALNGPPDLKVLKVVAGFASRK